MKIFLFLIIMISTVTNAQKKDIIYRVTTHSYPAVGYSYEVGVLRLHEDYNYSLIWQKYNSRKMARKNILKSSNKEIGIWKVLGDTLELCDDNENYRKFILIDDKKMFFLIEGCERAGEYWKKIKH